jgi:hypothetical protein
VAGSSISYGSFFGVSKLLWEEFYVAKDPWMSALPKREIKFYFLFFEKRIYFGSFKYPEVRETKYKNHQIRILGFLLCSQKYRS